MGKLKIILLPFGAALELFILAYCWLMVGINQSHSKNIAHWSICNMPDIEWYKGE